MNPILWDNFESLYDRLVFSLEKELREPVHWAQEKAFPGFHIFENSYVNSLSSAQSAHFDRQYEPLDWGQIRQTWKNARTLSFTLPLRLPASGAGLMIWNVLLQDVLQMNHQAARNHVRLAEKEPVHYEVGKLICHDGHYLHMIRPWRGKPEEHRITLQGHCIRVDGTWLCYW